MEMQTTMTNFKDTEYTKESLDAMADDALLALRNDVADALGVANVRNFKDHAMAVDQTWRALEKFEQLKTAPELGDKPKKVRAPKEAKEAKERGLAKSAEAKTVKRPTRKMFSTIKKIKEHDGTQGRGHRWLNYKDGMTLVDVIETEGTEPWDVWNWQTAGLLEVTEPTDAEYAERKAAWYAKHGLTDPDMAKEQKDADRAAAKAKREAEAAVKKEAAAKAKADAEAAKAAATE